jgi:hypothetical protein
VFGGCDTPSCENISNEICDDCGYIEQCRECINMYMDRSVSYAIFIEGSSIFTCIFCFVELQHGELHKPSIGKTIMENIEQPGR